MYRKGGVHQFWNYFWLILQILAILLRIYTFCSVHKQALIMRWCTKTHEYQMMLRASSCMISSVLCVTTKLEYNSHSVKVFSDILYLLYLSLSIGKHHTEALFSMFNRYIRYRKELDKICLNLIFVCEKNLGPGVPRVYRRSNPPFIILYPPCLHNISHQTLTIQ